MRAVLRSCAAFVLALLTAGCALFGATEEEPTELEELPVVADDQPFDPSQAVDDDDDLEPWQPRTEQDVDAFARSDSKVRNSESGSKETAAASGRGARAAPGDAKDGKNARGAKDATSGKGERDKTPGAKLPSDERVAGPREVQQRRAQRREEFASIDREESADGDAKAEFAGNPPPEEVGKSKSTAWTMLDYSLEGTLLLTFASGITALLALARRFPKTVMITVAVALAALAVAVGSQGE